MKRLLAVLGVLAAATSAFAQQTDAPLQLDWQTAGAAGTVLVRNATIWTQDEAGILTGADLLIRDGKIVGVGQSLDAPAGATIIDGTGMHVTPGIIDAHNHNGTFGGTNEASNNITAEVNVEDVLDPDQTALYQQLAGGTTAAQILHGSANSIGGRSAIVKWRFGAARSRELLIEGAIPTIKFALGENPKRSAFTLPLPIIPSRYPVTRMGVANSIRRAFLRAKDYQAEWQSYEALSDEAKMRTVPPRRDVQLDVLVEILEGERLVHSHSYRQDEIIMLIRVAEEMGFQVAAFQHVLEGYKASHEIADHGAGASTFADWWGYKFEVYDAIAYNGAMMHDDGVVVSFNSDDTELARHLNLEAAKAARFGGVPEQEALAFVTSNPARQLRLFDRIGSLRAGKDADFVVWNDHPLSVYARVEMTFVDGRKVFDRELDGRIRTARAAEKERLIALVEGGDEDESDAAEDGEAEDSQGAEPAMDAEPAQPEAESDGDDDSPPYRFPDPVARQYAAAPHDSPTVAIVGATVHTVSGAAIDNGVVVFANGVISAVGGPDTAIPADAQRIDGSGRHLYPGMISMDSQLGLAEITGGVPGSVDLAEIDEFNSDLRAEVAVNVANEGIPVTRSTGVTHALTIPRGGRIMGASALLRLDGWSWEEMTGLSRAGMHMSFPGGAAGAFGFGGFGAAPSEDELKQQREEALQRVDEMLDGARAYARAKDAEADGGRRHDVDVKLEGLVPVVRGHVPLFVHTNGARAIAAALEWAAGQELRIVIVDSGDTWRAAEALAAANVPVVVARVQALPPNPDDAYDSMYANAAHLHEAGVLFAIADADTGGGTDDRNLPNQAGMAAAFGLPRDAAVRAVTLSPARILGLGDRLGSIDVGKSATLVMTDGDLLEIRTHVLEEWIDGLPVELESKQTRLWRQWRDRPRPAAR